MSSPRALVCTVFLAGLLAASCGGGDSATCVPGTSIACTCTNGLSGAQVCGADETYGACSCDGADAPTTDAPIADAPPQGPCDPLAAPGAQNCATGQKCTWIVIQETPEPLGVVGCVPDGNVPNGQACTVGPAGETTGYDDCSAGNICVGGTCADVCGFDGSAGAACATGYNCTRYSGLFANGADDPVAGACSPACDPVTQTVTGGGMCPTGDGCYLLTSATETIAVCADAGDIGHNQPITGPVFANSCLPGHQPRRASPSAPNSFECGALCAPSDVTSTTNMTDEGGDSPYTCESKGASPPDSATAGESCRYYWAREPFDTLSPYSNTVGFCWKHAIWQYDTNGDMTPDSPFPRCITLTTGDIVPPIGNPPHNDAEYFWCLALPATLTGAAKAQSFPEPVRQLDRIGRWR